MKKVLWILAGMVTVTALQAADSLVLKGSGQQPHGIQPVPWQFDLVPLAFLLVGLGHLFCPRVAWWFKWGWRFQDTVEPSALWLFCERLGGVFIILVAVAVFLIINGIVQLPH